MKGCLQMHHQLQQEIRTALQRACVQDPAKIADDVQRLRSLDLQREIPVFEYQRLECIAAARIGRYKDATGMLLQLPVGAGEVLKLLSECPERARGDFRTFLTVARREVEAARAKGAKAARRSTGPEPAMAPGPAGAGRGAGSKVLTAMIVLGLVALVSAASWLAWHKLVKSPGGEAAIVDGGGADDVIESITVFPGDEIGTVERHVARVVLEIRVRTAEDEFLWVPWGTGTAFPVDKGLYLTNRHVVEIDDSSRSRAEELFETEVLDERIVLVGSFGYGVLKEVPAKISFIGVDRNDDLALLTVDSSLGHRCGFARVPPRRSKVFAVGFPGVSDDMAMGLAIQADSDVMSDLLELTRAEQQDADGSLDLVRFFGPRRLEPTTNDGIVSKEELTDGVLQTNAVIARGNSGGPLLDERGQVIGINTWIAGDQTSEGFGASIRSDRIRRILAGSSYHPRIDWGDVDDDED